MDPMTLMALLGVVKSQAIDAPQAARQAQAKAEIMRYSPWTHLDPASQQVKYADPFASAMSGAAMGQNLSNASAWKDALQSGNLPSGTQAPGTTPSVYNGGGSMGMYQGFGNPWAGQGGK